MASRKNIFLGNVVDLGIESVELPNGAQLDMEIIRHPGGAAVTAINNTGDLCLLYQYRHAAGGWLWEIPAGKLEKDETPKSTAIRELKEEAGLLGNTWRSLGSIVTTPAICDEEIHLFLATELQDVPTQHEPTELIEIHWVPLTTAVEQVHSGKVRDAKTVIGILLAATVMNQA